MSTFLGLWEIGTPKVCIFRLIVFAAQILIAEINRRWNWTIFALWTIGDIAITPHVTGHGIPMVGWFPFDKFAIMVATATMTGFLLFYGKHHPGKVHRYTTWFGAALWIGLTVNIMETNIRDLTIYLQADTYYQCTSDWQCLKVIDEARSIPITPGLPETRDIVTAVGTPEWYQAAAQNFTDRHIGIDPATDFRTIGGYWNILSALAGLLNIITITGLGKIMITSNLKQKVKGLIWIDMVWPWVICYDLWNHAFLYNSLTDYTQHCTFALLLVCTVPAFTWAKGQWVWSRCFTLMFWIAANDIVPEVLAKPSFVTNFVTMNPMANIVCIWAALIANVALFVCWLYKILRYRRNLITGVLYCELSEFRIVARTHLDDVDKYFLTDFIEQTSSELGPEPSSCTPPRDGWVGWMPWWKVDKRYPKPRTPLSVGPVVVVKIRADSSWDVRGFSPPYADEVGMRRRLAMIFHFPRHITPVQTK